MTMYSIVESEDWMKTEVRCGCIGTVVEMHPVEPELHECAACGATWWLSDDGRILSQWNDVGAEVESSNITVTATLGAEWAVAKP